MTLIADKIVERKKKKNLPKTKKIPEFKGFPTKMTYQILRGKKKKKLLKKQQVPRIVCVRLGDEKNHTNKMTILKTI